MRSVSCVIPAYNEAVRIGAVLQAVMGHPMVSETIVVDDGSQDPTAEVVRDFAGVTLLTQPKNGGKARAIVEGVRRAQGPLLLLLDSDLVGLTPGDITALVEPVLAGVADMSISLRRNAPPPWHWIGLDYISGERVVEKAFLEPMLGRFASMPGFALEVSMNKEIVRQKLRIAVVPWKDVDSPLKFRKHGWWIGIKGDVKMMYHIFRVLSPLAALCQIMDMLRLRI